MGEFENASLYEETQKNFDQSLNMDASKRFSSINQTTRIWTDWWEHKREQSNKLK